MKGIGGSMPQMVRNAEQPGIKRLYFSQREIALIKDKTISAGYGVLKAGTILATNLSAAGNKGQLVPYVPVFGKQVLGTDTAKGIATLVQDGVSGNFKVSVVDSYKFVVGDDLVVQNTTGDALTNIGAISAIDRTGDSRWVSITVPAYTATNMTVAKGSYIFVEAGTTPFSLATFMLDKDVDTGTGEEAVGALAPILISNAIVYSGSLVNATSEALTSLGAVQDGPHTIIK
jgi:hypothetical protein